MDRPHIPIARPLLSQAERQAVLAVLDSGRLVAGAQVRAFEQAFAAYIGSPRAVATSSGTTALQVALEAAGIGPGDAVITTPFTFVATSNAILHVGARPVFVDVDPRTYNLDPAAVEAAAREQRARALLCVHLYGLPAEMRALGEIADRYGLLLIEDCAQAHGARYAGRRVGTFGRAAIFSFYPSKNMTTGEGGMVVTADAALARAVRLLVNVGQDGTDYVYEAVGYNYRMTEIAAAIGLAQLSRLDAHNARRREHARRLTEGLAGLPWLLPPVEPPGCEHVYNQYTVRVRAGRDRFVRYLQDRGIGCRVYYPELIPHSPAYRRRGFGGRFPVAEQLAAEVVSLPVHPGLTEPDLTRIIETVRAYPAGAD